MSANNEDNSNNPIPPHERMEEDPMHPIKNFNKEQNLSFNFTTEKAGMVGLNREEIDKVIYEVTKDSAITRKKMEDLERIKLIVQDHNNSLNNLHKNEFLFHQNKILADSKIKQLKASRRFDKIWMHIDMDMFYAAVEIRDNPSLADKPVAVGSEQMVSTSNYVARKFGVRSAMPGFIAKRICPELVFVRPNFHKYHTESNKIMNILRYYDENIEVRGLDEAYLELTSYCGKNYISFEPEIKELVKEIQNKIYTETKLTASCGVACNKMLAKICSDIHKPAGSFILTNNSNEIEEFMRTMKIRKIPFVGEKLEKKLNLMKMYTCKDVIERYVDIFYLFSENQFEFLLGSCYGLGPYHHEESREMSKSISVSDTFRLTNNMMFLNKMFLKLCSKLHSSMEEMTVAARTLTVEITDQNERHLCKSTTNMRRFETEQDLIKTGWNLLKALMENLSIRMMRVKVSSLQSVSPDALKKKEESEIKHWISKLEVKGNVHPEPTGKGTEKRQIHPVNNQPVVKRMTIEDMILNMKAKTENGNNDTTIKKPKSIRGKQNQTRQSLSLSSSKKNKRGKKSNMLNGSSEKKKFGPIDLFLKKMNSTHSLK